MPRTTSIHSLGLALLATACASRSPTAASTEPIGASPPPSASAQADEPTTYQRPTGPALVFGHRDARYEVVVPPGFRAGLQIRADGADRAALEEHGIGGVGPVDDPTGASAVVLFSDPRGLGVDMDRADPPTRERYIALYGDVLRQRFPQSTAPEEVEVGPHRAIRVDMSNVVLSGRPARHGRHYFILDGTTTVAVDCLWTDDFAERLSVACDAVAASVLRVANGD